MLPGFTAAGARLPCVTHPVAGTLVVAAMWPSYSDATIFSNLEVVL